MDDRVDGAFRTERNPAQMDGGRKENAHTDDEMDCGLRKERKTAELVDNGSSAAGNTHSDSTERLPYKIVQDWREGSFAARNIKRETYQHKECTAVRNSKIDIF